MKAQEIIVLQSCGVKVGDDPSSPESFTIITPGKTFKLQDTTFPAALEWANAIAVAAASLMKQLTNTANVSSSNLSVCFSISKIFKFFTFFLKTDIYIFLIA